MLMIATTAEAGHASAAAAKGNMPTAAPPAVLQSRVTDQCPQNQELLRGIPLPKEIDIEKQNSNGKTEAQKTEGVQ